MATLQKLVKNVKQKWGTRVVQILAEAGDGQAGWVSGVSRRGSSPASSGRSCRYIYYPYPMRFAYREEKQKKKPVPSAHPYRCVVMCPTLVFHRLCNRKSLLGSRNRMNSAIIRLALIHQNKKRSLKYHTTLSLLTRACGAFNSSDRYSNLWMKRVLLIPVCFIYAGRRRSGSLATAE